MAGSESAVERLYRSFAEHDPAGAIAAIEAAKASGTPHAELFDAVFVPALAMLGEKWAAGDLDEIAFTEAAVVAEQVTSFVVPPATAPDRGITVIVGCVEGDRHDLRKNVFAAALKSSGYRVVDLGVSTSPDEFITGLDETGARVILAFAEMVGTAGVVRRIRDRLDAEKRSDVVLLVSGGPFEADPDVARLLGANGVANAAQSVLRIIDRVAADRLGSA